MRTSSLQRVPLRRGRAREAAAPLERALDRGILGKHNRRVLAGLVFIAVLIGADGSRMVRDLARAMEAASRKPRALVKARNPKRRKRLFARNYGDDGQHGAWIREQPCAVPTFSRRATHCDGKHEAAHAKDRGMGGCKGDRRDLLCLCARHHGEHGEGHKSFDAKHQINCESIAAMMWAESPFGAAWEESHGD